MELSISKTTAEAGRLAATRAAELLKQAVQQNGSARFMAATGQSQLPFYEVLLQQDIPWQHIDILHLDEYVALPEDHPASFRKYIRERFVAHISPMAVYYIDGNHPAQALLWLNELAAQRPVDVGMIGFGENTHIAFNDPPADFETTLPYHLVTLDPACKRQQAGEGWFETPGDVPDQAISASVHYIKSFRHIVSLIPYEVKAQATKKVLTAKIATPLIPGTALLDHPSWHIYLDAASASKLDRPHTDT